MATPNMSSRFQSWNLSETEFFQGSILTALQRQVIQNQISTLAHQRINIKFDPYKPLEFAQEEAELKGQIHALEYLLTLSAEAETRFDPGLLQRNLDLDQFPSPAHNPSQES